MRSFIVSGTDTGIGKTLLCGILMASLPEYSYWKPIQSGMDDGADSETVARLSGCSKERILPEAYFFSQPLSPHLASAIDGIPIEEEKLVLPRSESLIVEGAGGLLVPLTDRLLYIDIFKKWKLPVLLACRSTLGTINHSLLSIEALRKRGIPVLGCVLINQRNPPNEQAIAHYGNVPILGHIPILHSFEPDNLVTVYNNHLSSIRSIL